MLDEAWCQSMTLEEQPRIAVDALRLLRSLVDLQMTSSGTSDMEHGFMEMKGDCHEPSSPGSAAGTATNSAPTET